MDKSIDKPSLAITTSDISELLSHMASKNYESTSEDEIDRKFLNLCYKLWTEDYECHVLENTNGFLCRSYPSKIIIPHREIASQISEHSISSLKFFSGPSQVQNVKATNEANEKYKLENSLSEDREKSPPSNSEKESTTSCSNSSIDELRNGIPSAIKEKYVRVPAKLSRLILDSRTARCRNRFPIPVIYCNKKTVVRSSTLACWFDASVKAYLDTLSSPDVEVDEHSSILGQLDSSPEKPEQDDDNRSADIKLLRKLKVSSIMDLMVEKKKLYLYNMIPVSSSEKADAEQRYSKFKIYSLPYPGCEFFKNFHERSYNSEDLYYDWSLSINDAELKIPNTETNNHLEICSNWESYKNWDLRNLTSKYLKLILSCLKEDSNETGLLVHCISGWDRTPLFISLLRLSLWSEGLAHTSLDAKQMLFFTLAYDWFLFGHLFPTRFNSDENILYFCFEFLFVLIKEEKIEVKKEKDFSNDTNNLDSLEKIATLDIGTPTSFGSCTSLASNSSLTHCAKVSPIKTSHTEDKWPYNKENGFTFDGIKEGDKEIKATCDTLQNVDVLDGSARFESASLKAFPSSSRSPLKDRNKSSSEMPSRKSSGGEDANLSTSNTSTASSGSSTSESGRVHKGSGRRNINGLFKGLTRRSKRSSGSCAKYNTSMDSVELDNSGDSKFESCSSSPNPIESSCSMPVPVPSSGGSSTRSRHSSNCSSVGSWQMVSTSPSRDYNISSVESTHSSRFSHPYEMIDSTCTITEELPPSSHGSDTSIEHFTPQTKKKKLSEVRELFYKIYGEIPELNKSKPSASTLFSLYN